MSVAQQLPRVLGRDGPGAKLLQGRLREQQFDNLIGHDPGVANMADGHLQAAAGVPPPRSRPAVADTLDAAGNG